MMTGAAWMIGMRWGMRGLGIISTAILARLLTPEDFGVVAMAMIFVAIVYAFQDFGIDMAIIRLREVTDAHYHTAWTISLIAGAGLAVILVALAPVTAAFFDDPRVQPVMWAFASLPVLQGMVNIRTADFRRNLDFAREFRFNLVVRVLGVAASIVFALWLRDYWALVFGMIASGLLRVIVSYVMIPVAPRLSLAAGRELWAFSGWIQLRSVGQTLGLKVDQILIGRVLGTGQLGGYNVCYEITNMATNEIVMPIGRSLLPGYAKIVDDKERLRRAFEKVLSAHIILAFALGGGLFLVSPSLVPILLGAQWLDYIPVFQVLALSGACIAVASGPGPLLIAVGAVRGLAMVGLLQVALAVGIMGAIVVFDGGLEEIAMGRVGVSAAYAMALVVLAIRLTGVEPVHTLRLFARPAAATILMAIAVNGLTSVEPDASAFVLLPLQVVSGALVYCAAIAGLWALSGQPEGAEKDLMEQLGARLEALRRSRGWRSET